MTNTLSLDHVAVSIDRTAIIDDVSLEISEGQICCLLGPSGCGKTTLLRTIAGFQQPSAGEVRMDGRIMATASTMVPPEKRQIGMVFQDLALFPHLSVAENIAFGMRKFSKKQIRERTKELLQLVELEHLIDAYPHQLSGGQQQRIALIRAMAPRPRLLLLDEPFSSQDTERRVQLAHEVRNILRRDGTTAILVTHDQKEAFAIADMIGVVEGGRLHQWDTAYNLYHDPADRFVAHFIGEGVFICGSVLNETTLQTDLGEISGEFPPYKPGTPIDLLVRPDDIIHDDHSDYSGELVEKDFRGADHLYKVRMPGNTNVLCLAPSHHNHHIGERIGIRIEPDHLVVYPREDALTSLPGNDG
ncbi:ABC transporter ATP-binding protein [Granulosicoccaceae sp. 1_MG-2023]|nr:ABC transporter ATP-binding protein [Granulosicoccaceae sp. 1_MG-2023]